MSWTLWSIAIVGVVTALFVSIAAPFWIVYAIEVIGISEYEWGFLMLLIGILRIVVSIPVGHFVDRYGSKRMILMALLLAPIPIFLFTFCKTFLTVLAILAIMAIVNTIISPAFSTLMTNVIPLKRRGRLLALLGRGTAISYGGVYVEGFLLFIPVTVGSLLGGYVYEANPQYPWFILTFAIISCLVMSFLFIHEPKKPED
jgi:DHA1 family multidrug resistance protein-like MFS transporter